MTTATEIIPNLWIGNILNSSNKEFISKIDIVINCSKNIAFSSNKTKNLRISSTRAPGIKLSKK